MPFHKNRLTGAGTALALAAIGAGTGWLIGLPLALLIGPMIILTISAQRFPALHIPQPLYAGSLIVLGLSLGQYFTPDLIASWRHISASLVLNAIMSVLGMAMGFILLYRLFGLDPATAIFAGLPGGILTVMEVSRESSADTSAVMFFQISRIIMGASLIPLGFGLAGFEVPPGVPSQASSDHFTGLVDMTLLFGGGIITSLLGRKLRFPSAEISVPLIWSALLYGSGVINITIPDWMPALNFIIIGAAIGTFLPRPGLRILIRLTTQTLILFACFMVLTVIIALIARHFMGIGFGSGILIFSPAGLTEMIAVALALNMEPTLVAANNLFRMIFCSLLAPFILIWLRQNASENRSASGKSGHCQTRSES
ncbi:MAG: AbrB family transcriptional regulator [Paracoccus sp. (in: a-proteobacteria)]